MESIQQLILDYRYAIILPLAFVEGPIVSFVVGVLVAAGYFNALIAYCVLVLGDLIPDTVAYVIGRRGEPTKLLARYGQKIGIGPNQLELVRRLWYRHGGKTMMASKIAYGLSTAFLVSAGLVDLPWRRFLALAMSVSLVQYALLMTLGYFVGESFGVVDIAVETIGIAVTATVLLSAGYFFVSRHYRAQLLAETHQSKSESS